MKNKVTITLIVITIVMTFFFLLNFTRKITELEYAKKAADQLEDVTNAYRVLHTQTGTGVGLWWAGAVILIVAIFVLVKVWVPKKYFKRADKAVNNWK